MGVPYEPLRIVMLILLFAIINTDKPASGSSLYRNHMWFPNDANDGIYGSSFFHSGLQYQPWWRVNLEKVYCVWAMNILNRAGK